MSDVEARPLAPSIDASTTVSPGIDGADWDKSERYAGERRHWYRCVRAQVGWMVIRVARMGHHDVSKVKDTRASWCPLRMGPMIIGPPHRGQDHVGVVGSTVVSDERCRSNRRARVSRAVRQ